VAQNYFSGLEIDFRTTEIYFKGTEMYFQATEKVLYRGAEKLLPRGKDFIASRQNIFRPDCKPHMTQFKGHARLPAGRHDFLVRPSLPAGIKGTETHEEHKGLAETTHFSLITLHISLFLRNFAPAKSRREASLPRTRGLEKGREQTVNRKSLNSK